MKLLPVASRNGLPIAVIGHLNLEEADQNRHFSFYKNPYYSAYMDHIHRVLQGAAIDLLNDGVSKLPKIQIEVRTPEDTARYQNYSANKIPRKWHHDGSNDDCEYGKHEDAVILVSTSVVTEFRVCPTYSKRLNLTFEEPLKLDFIKPGDIVVFDNRFLEHRTPDNPTGADRHFGRAILPCISYYTFRYYREPKKVFSAF